MGCTSCNSNKGPCGNKSTVLRNFRKMATTLYNVSKDPLKRIEYKEAIVGIDELIVGSKITCPSQEEINLLRAYLESEQSKRI